MADNDNRTMPASPRRRREAREQGQVAQSRLLRTAGQLLVVVVAASWALSHVIDALAAIFGTLRAGGAYVPVDPTAPARRNAYIFGDCSVRAATSRT